MPFHLPLFRELKNEKMSLKSRIALLDKLRPKQIGWQIGAGYLTAILVGWIGSTAGIVIADYFQGRGILQLLDAQAQARLLIKFKETATQARLHATRSVLLNDHDEQQQAELAAFDQNLSTLANLRQDLETFLASEPIWLAQDAIALKSLITSYEQALRQKYEQVNAYASTDESSLTVPISTPSGETSPIDQLHANLVDVIRIAQDQESMAADAMESAQGLEKLIIIVSITTAGIIAGLMAWRVTLAIATPLQNVTQTARRVASDADYNLRATVFADDEVGMLAHSLNELIERVGERTRSLEQAAQQAVTQNQELAEALRNLRKAQSQLVQAEKMSSLGQLVAGIAHEVNNPIGFIQGNLKYLKEYSDTLFQIIDSLQADLSTLSPNSADTLEEEDFNFVRQDLPKVLKSINNGTERINGLILSLKVFSRLQESQLKTANLNEGLESSLILLGYRLKSQSKRPEIQVTRCYQELPAIDCFSSQMNQVFMNILNNAIDAIDERWDQSPGNWKPEIIVDSELTKDHIRIAIQNNGLAIPLAVQEKVFDPFFTTKPVGKGAGLGMSISYEVVCKKHGGHLSFVSPIEGDIGTKFCLEIPVLVAQATDFPAHPDEPVAFVN